MFSEKFLVQLGMSLGMTGTFLVTFLGQSGMSLGMFLGKLGMFLEQ